MTRKDSEKDSERPHYYSQFWLDIAAGRRTIGGPKPEEEGELLEDTPEPPALHRPLLRSEPEEDLDGNDGRIGHVERGDERPAALAHPVSDTPVISSNEDVEPEPDEVPLEVDNVEDLGLMNDTVEDADIPDMDLAADDEGDEDEEEFFEEEEEEEEDDGWAASRGRKKVTPKRATKLPPKRTKREPRRGF
ncbi:MAG: hypothetical protein NVSMB49_09020 [Ktedonobacteraceae bacterium]